MNIVEQITAAREKARAVLDRHLNPGQKQASLALYAALAAAYAVCERCERNPAEAEDIRALVRADVPEGAKGRWIERDSTVYQVVCRFIFTTSDRNNANRYALALNEAAKRQISSDDLAGWLKTNGGVAALYFGRPLDARKVRTKCLHLASPVEFPRDGDFSLRLRWRPDNRFDVMGSQS